MQFFVVVVAILAIVAQGFHTCRIPQITKSKTLSMATSEERALADYKRKVQQQRQQAYSKAMSPTAIGSSGRSSSGGARAPSSVMGGGARAPSSVMGGGGRPASAVMGGSSPRGAAAPAPSSVMSSARSEVKPAGASSSRGYSSASTSKMSEEDGLREYKKRVAIQRLEAKDRAMKRPAGESGSSPIRSSSGGARAPSSVMGGSGRAPSSVMRR